jgi:Cu(I)/Ag(I) efflux system periplasmic protein CusF
MHLLCAHFLATVALVFSATPHAQVAPPGPAAPAAVAHGEVVEVYPKDRRVLLKHGPIDALGMGPMTMEFGVRHRKLLIGLKRGQAVRFHAEQRGDDYVITRIEPAR